MSAAYALFARFKWAPSLYYNMSHGERKVVRAFLSYYAAQIEAERKEMESK